MEIKQLHQSWAKTAEQILENDIKDLSVAEKEVLLRSFLSGAQTFMNCVRVELDSLKGEINKKLTDSNHNIIAISAVDWAKQRIENCEIHLNKQ